MHIKKTVALLLMMAMLLGMADACAYTPGVYEAEAKGFGGMVKVAVTTDGDKIIDVSVTGDAETQGIGSNAIEQLPQKIVAANSTDVDVVAGATVTSEAIKNAVKDALAVAMGESASQQTFIKFVPGSYTGIAQGYNAPIKLLVTFSEKTIEKIEVLAHMESEHVGDTAIPLMIENIIAFTSTGVDTVAGATVTSNAVLAAVRDAAVQAGGDVKALNKGAKPFTYIPGETIENTFDVVIVGAGGAGMAAGAAAAQAGATVAVLETNMEMGGNTLVAGGAFQAVAKAYVFDPENPDATTGVDPIFGEVQKSKSNLGNLATLKRILDWSEKPFDGAVVDAASIKTVDDYNLPERGVHQEFLPTLQTLKNQIKVYMNYADRKMAEGALETDLTLFSTEELHIFQTYYGGLRLNADKTEWIHNQFELVNQFVRSGYQTKEWLAAQGATFSPDRTTSTLIGCLWQRINGVAGGVVDGVEYKSKWGAYFKVPENTILKANEKNCIMTRTTATELIQDADGRVVGVKAVRFDGTEVVLHAVKGVILATGGFGANIKMVTDTNQYWDKDDLTMDILSTNRSSADGSGIVMGQAVGAAVTGMGYTQLMPLGWVDNGDLAGGTGENVIFIASAEHENAGQRYVDESAERDVLSQGAFDFGDEKGVYIELSNGAMASTAIDPRTMPVEGRTYYCTLEEAAELLHINAKIIEKTVTEYDAYVMGITDVPPVPAKNGYTATIGTADKDEKGRYLPDTYRIEKLKVRLMRPSTHHTMGGLVVDTQRHVLREDGSIIKGLYAAGEVTGGFFAGNRLGGNAITEILVSGRIAGENAAEGK